MTNDHDTWTSTPSTFPQVSKPSIMKNSDPDCGEASPPWIVGVCVCQTRMVFGLIKTFQRHKSQTQRQPYCHSTMPSLAITDITLWCKLTGNVTRSCWWETRTTQKLCQPGAQVDENVRIFLPACLIRTHQHEVCLGSSKVPCTLFHWLTPSNDSETFPTFDIWSDVVICSENKINHIQASRNLLLDRVLGEGTVRGPVNESLTSWAACRRPQNWHDM